MAITPEERKKIDALAPNLRAKATELFDANDDNEGDPDDPMVWEFNNPFTAIWTGKDATKVGYNQKPRSKVLQDFYNLSPDELKRFQELAFQAGLYGASAEREDISFGARDPDTFKLWAQMTDQAARYGAAGKKFTIWDSIQELVDNRPESAGKKKSTRPLVTELPDPRAVEEMVRGVAPSVIGRDADPAFTSDFIAMYTKIVSDYQANKYALENTEAGGTITAPPDAQSLAAFRLRTENPEQYEEKRSAARAAAYTSLLKGAL